MGTLNIPLLYIRSETSLNYIHLPGIMMNPLWLKLSISLTNFLGPKDVGAIEVRLYKPFDELPTTYVFTKK